MKEGSPCPRCAHIYPVTVKNELWDVHYMQLSGEEKSAINDEAIKKIIAIPKLYAITHCMGCGFIFAEITG